MVLINTVLESRTGLSQIQYDGAKQAQYALTMVGYPSEKYFKNMVHDGMIPNRPVNLDGIKNANKIFVPDATSLKGKMVMQKPKPVVSNYIKIQKEILKLHKTVLVVAYIYFFQRGGIPSQYLQSSG